MCVVLDLSQGFSIDEPEIERLMSCREFA